MVIFNVNVPSDRIILCNQSTKRSWYLSASLIFTVDKNKNGFYFLKGIWYQKP